jgi:outer membrane receptor protein involved in Fe transport
MQRAAAVLCFATAAAASAEDEPKGLEANIVGRLDPGPSSAADAPPGVEIVTREQIAASGAASLPQYLSRLAGVNTNDEQGNSFQQDVSLRGMTASSVTGLAQGISVFLDGVRVNEPTAEEVNFDLIPLEDVERVEIIRGPSPVFGRNTLGGAINIITRRGGQREASAEVGAGFFGQEKYRVQASGDLGPFDGYISATHFSEDGYRRSATTSIDGIFLKLGYRCGPLDVALSYQQQSNSIGQPGSLPLDAAATDPRQSFTPGDFFAPHLHFLTLNGKLLLGAGFSLDLNLFGRKLDQQQFNVNLADDNTRLFSQALSAGGVAQLTHDFRSGMFRNQLVAGLDVVRHRATIHVNEEQNDASLSECLDGGGPCPLSTDISDLQDDQTAIGVFGQDHLTIGEALSLTAGVRYDYVSHSVVDTTPSAPGQADGDVSYSRAQPMASVAWRFAKGQEIYATYAEGFRPPSFLELTCASATAPCVGLQAGVAQDPTFFTLQAVKARSYELGARGSQGVFEGRVALYRIDLTDDIFSVSPAGTVNVFFQNIGDTRRQGVEASLRARAPGLGEAQVSYVYAQATFSNDVSLSSATQPGTQEQVPSGSNLPLSPHHRLSADATWEARPWLRLSLDGSFVSEQFFRGDEANALAPLSAYFVMGATATAKYKGLTVRLRVNNLLDSHYATFGTFAPNGKVDGSPVQPFISPAATINAFLSAGYSL